MKSRSPRRRGTAMSETVLVMPILVFILVLLIYFGRGIVRVQHAQVMDRYETWRHVAASPGPQAAPGNGQLNDLFFGGRALEIDGEQCDLFPRDVVTRLINVARAVRDETGTLVERQHLYGDHGRTFRFSTDHRPTLQFLEQFEGKTRHAHTRLGNDWAWVNGWQTVPQDGQTYGGWERAGPYGPNVMLAARDVFYPDFDRDLRQLNSPLASGIRAIYLTQPQYRGPTVRTGDNP